MVRQTSLQAFKELKESKLLGHIQFLVYETLFNHGPLTGNEMKDLISNKGNSGVYTTRLSELERLRVIQTVGKRYCKITGKKVLQWDVTDHVPTERIVRTTKKDKIESIINGVGTFKQMINDPQQVIKREWLTRQLNRLTDKIRNI